MAPVKLLCRGGPLDGQARDVKFDKGIPLKMFLADPATKKIIGAYEWKNDHLSWNPDAE